MSYLKLKKLITDSEKRLTNKNKKTFFDKYANFISILIALAALVYTVWRTETTIQMARESNEESQRSSQLTQDLANKTISYLQSISNSSSSLDTNLTNFSSALTPLTKELLNLTKNLVSVNELSGEQLKNLSTINANIQKQLDDLERKRQEEEFEKSKKPEIVLVMQCDSVKNEYSIFVKNIGFLEATVSSTLFDWHSIQGPRKDVEILRRTEPIVIATDFDKSYFKGDSLSAKIRITYSSLNGSGDTTFFYVKCGVTKINERK